MQNVGGGGAASPAHRSNSYIRLNVSDSSYAINRFRIYPFARWHLFLLAIFTIFALYKREYIFFGPRGQKLGYVALKMAPIKRLARVRVDRSLPNVDRFSKFLIYFVPLIRLE